MSEQQDRQQEQDWRDSEPFDAKKYKNFYQLAGGAFVTIVILLIGGFIYSRPEAGYWVNIYATLVGTILTIAVLDRRAEQRAIRERKDELILQMGSPDNGFALEAVRLLRHKGWLEDGSLRDAVLQLANLQGAQLGEANLQGVDVLAATFSESTVLPDYSSWAPGRDLREFTYPEIWKAEHPNSPSYTGRIYVSE